MKVLVKPASNSPLSPSVSVRTRVLDDMAVLVEHVPPPAIVEDIEMSDTVLPSAMSIAFADDALKALSPAAIMTTAASLETNLLNIHSPKTICRPIV